MAPKLRPHLGSHATDLSMPVIPNHAYLSLVLETEDGPVEVDHEMLDRLGLSPAMAFDSALEWLRDHAGPHEVADVDTVPGMSFIQPDAGQTASRLAVLPDLLDPAPLGGTLVAIPSGNQVLCVPVHSIDAVNALRALAGAVGTAYEHATHPISDQLFWHDGAVWHVVHVDRGEADITVLPPQSFFDRMRQVASMDLVRVAGEA